MSLSEEMQLVLAEAEPGAVEREVGWAWDLLQPERLQPGTPLVIDVITHCGLGYLVPEIDGRLWLTDEAAGTFEWGPPEWAAVIDRARELIELEIVLSEDRNILTATANGRSVIYRPLTPEDLQFRCA